MFCFNLHTNNGDGQSLYEVLNEVKFDKDVHVDFSRTLGFMTETDEEYTELVEFCEDLGAELLYHNRNFLYRSENLAYYQFKTLQDAVHARLRMS